MVAYLSNGPQHQRATSLAGPVDCLIVEGRVTQELLVHALTSFWPAETEKQGDINCWKCSGEYYIVMGKQQAGNDVQVPIHSGTEKQKHRHFIMANV